VNPKLVPFLIFAVLIAFVFGIGTHGCTRPDETRQLLEAQGYTSVTITGYRPFMKTKDEVYSTGFEATSPSGARVKGAVTKGAFKGQTIRFD
jgi:hypothetical protein